MADKLKPQRYKDTRPAELFLPVHEWSRTHDPGWIYEAVRMVLTPIAVFIYRARGISVGNVPAEGPFILAPNHFSNMDHFFAGVYIRRKIRFMAKSQLFFSNAILDYIYRVGGVFPVRRGHNDSEAFITAYSILDRGGCVLIYAEGGRSRIGRARRGQARRRTDGARVGSAGGPGGDPRFVGSAGVEAALVPEGDRPVRRAADLRGGRGPEPRAATGRRRTRSSTGSRRCTARSRSRGEAA